MPRVYTVSFENVAVVNPQDLVSLACGAGKMCRVLRAWCGPTDTSLQVAQGLRFRVRVHTATFTLGSGGSAPTPQKTDPGDAAASFTAHVNDTTQATTTGASNMVMAQGAHNYGSIDWPFKTPNWFGPSEGCTFELLSTVTGTCHFSGGVEVEETGG